MPLNAFQRLTCICCFSHTRGIPLYTALNQWPPSPQFFPHAGDAALTKVTPTRRCYHPAAIFQQSRAEVGPNSYARGDHIRPYYIGQRSAKREPLQREMNHIPGMVFPTRAGDTVAAAYCPKKHSRLFPYTRDTARIANEKAACFPAHGRIPRCRTPL